MDRSVKKILCIDDDRDDLLLLRQAIKKLSPINIIQAYSGVEAIAYLEKEKKAGDLPSLIVLDNNMPSMDGKQTIEAIKKDSQLKDITIVMFTTSAILDDWANLEKHKIDTLIKPNSWAAYSEIAKKLLSYVNS